jgi:HEAT repeat protein
MKQLLRSTALGACLAGLLLACSAKKSHVDVQAQIQALKSSDATARQNAAVELASAGPAAAPAVPALTEALKDPDPLVRRLACYALYEIGREHAASAIPEVTKLLQDPDRSVAEQAINTLQVLDPNAPKIQRANVMSDPAPAK